MQKCNFYCKKLLNRCQKASKFLFSSDISYLMHCFSIFFNQHAKNRLHFDEIENKSQKIIQFNFTLRKKKM